MVDLLKIGRQALAVTTSILGVVGVLRVVEFFLPEEIEEPASEPPEPPDEPEAQVPDDDLPGDDDEVTDEIEVEMPEFPLGPAPFGGLSARTSQLLGGPR